MDAVTIVPVELAKVESHYGIILSLIAFTLVPAFFESIYNTTSHVKGKPLLVIFCSHFLCQLACDLLAQDEVSKSKTRWCRNGLYIYLRIHTGSSFGFDPHSLWILNPSLGYLCLWDFLDRIRFCNNEFCGNQVQILWPTLRNHIWLCYVGIKTCSRR